MSKKPASSKLPWPARVGIALYGLAFVGIAFAPAEWMSEVIWAALIVGAIVWEMVGVKLEQRWNQEPLTHLYADRLMKLDKWGWVFRIAWLALFAWWIVHWVKRTPW